MLHMADTSYNASTDRITTGSRTGPASGDAIAEQADRAEESLQGIGERGEQYKQQTRRQRLISQRMRQLSEKDTQKGGLREPRNAKFQKDRDEKTERMPTRDAVFIGVVALLFDGLGGVISLLDLVAPPLGELINTVTIFPMATFFLYFSYKKRGIEFKDAKTLVRFWGSLVVGFIPIIAILPEYVLNVILVTLSTKAEDKLKV